MKPYKLIALLSILSLTINIGYTQDISDQEIQDQEMTEQIESLRPQQENMDRVQNVVFRFCNN